MSVSFGDSIRRGREAAGLSQVKVAQLIGRSPSTVRAWEQGRSNPADSSAVTAIAAVLGLDETNLLGKAGFEPAIPSAHRSLESELATLKTIESPVATLETSPRGVESEDGPVIAPAEPWIEFESSAPPNTLGRIEPKVKSLLTKVNELKSEFQQRLEDRPQREPRPKPEARPRPVIERKARSQPEVMTQGPQLPPVRLDPRLGTLTGRSYVEDAGERDFYRRRTVGTLLVLVFLFVTLWWALRNTGGAISEFVGGFIDELNFS